MIKRLTLITLAQAIILPCLSRRTGKPCRSEISRQLLLNQTGGGIQLVGCLDPQGRAHRTAVRDVLSVQRRLIVHAEVLGGAGRVWRELEALAPVAFSLDATGSPYQFVSLGSRDAVELIGAWPSPNGDITAMLRPICGMLISAADSVVPPFRQIGHLWPHGDFARPSGSLVLSFARRPGMLFAARYPLELAAKVIVRNRNVWGEAWEPEAPTDGNRHSALLMAGQYMPRPHVPLTAEILREAAKSKPVEDLETWWHDCSIWHAVGCPRWRNGRNLSGVLVSNDDPCIRHLLMTKNGEDSAAVLVR
ncbi:hypothetical protein SAMN04488503_0950 [Humidesulfovibrio mexicanus]|uniref:Uncharacterized protein n=1 Tax=Humidesulfovibrio mexicanus TaxID=147047 RepID=A0A238YH06_9BACT|nr:hypothetical protein [Humidesulfovibrio mexicanus]SNR70078.1 hypothetical protein SAMN04488503_0950 [Humidesulfovibrio mexicanus]